MVVFVEQLDVSGAALEGTFEKPLKSVVKFNVKPQTISGPQFSQRPARLNVLAFNAIARRLVHDFEQSWSDGFVGVSLGVPCPRSVPVCF